jgi:hypothetical protein
MATISLAAGNTKHATRGNGQVPYVVETIVDFADAATAKGSALAAADVITVLDIPAESVVLAAGAEVLTVRTGTTTDLTLDIGVTGVDADAFVDGFDFDAAAVGAYTSQPAAYQPIVVGNTADTLDILIATQTGTFTGGSLRVFALVLDVSDRNNAGTVDRDQLA